MKTLFVIAAISLCGISSAREADVPSPFWFSISEKILSETQSLFNIEIKETPKSAPKKRQVKVKAALNCEQEQQSLVLPFPTFKRGSGIWMIAE